MSKLTDIIKNTWDKTKDVTRKNKALLTIIPTLLTANLSAQEMQTRVPQTQREFQDLPASKRHMIMHELYSNEDIEKIEQLKFSNNNMYHASNAALQTKPTTGEGAIKIVNRPDLGIEQEPYVKLTMTGQSGGMWRNEVEGTPDHYTTFPSMFNAMRMNDEQAKKVLSLYTGWETKHIDIVRDDRGNVKHTTYSGPSNRHIIRDRYTVQGEPKEHARWMPGTMAKFPLKEVLQLMGTDINAVTNIMEKYEKTEDINEHLQELLDECNERNEELYDKKQELKAKKDTITQQKEQTDSLNTGLRNYLSKIEGGPGIFVTQDAELGYAINVGFPVGENNNTFALTGIYFPGTEKKVRRPDEIETETHEFENFPGTAVATDTLSSWTTTNKHSAKALLGYEVLNNLSLKAGVDFTKKNIIDTERLSSHTYMLSDDGEKYNHDASVQENTTETTKKEFNPVIGAGYNVGPVKVTGLYTPRKNEFSIGLIYNFNRKR